MKVATVEDWTDRMQKEEDFNVQKYVRAAIEAYQQNAALPSEAAVLHEVVAEHVQHRVKRKHERLVDNNRHRRCFQDVEAVDFRNKPVYVNGEHLDNMANLSGARDTFFGCLRIKWMQQVVTWWIIR